jgi:trimeric autotransporter adhesin
MKNNRLFLIITMILTLGANSQLFAKVYTPNTNRDITGSKKYCQGATPSNIRFRYYTCNSGTGTSSGTPITIKWYKNSTNSTTGGVVVSTTSANTTASTTGSVYYTPSTTTPGVSYYYCEITWSGTGTCNTTGSLKSTLTSAVTVGEVPSTITGNSTICMGTPTTMTNTSPGGTWKSSNTGRATVGLTTGVVNGVTIGTAKITFTALCGTRVSKSITVVNATTVNAISGGTSKICAGSTTNLTNTTSGGVWSSENTAIATISTSGVVRGIAPGTVNISYTVTGSCEPVYATKTVTVTTTPAAITGIAISCNGYSFDFENTVPFGVWSSSNTSVATIDSETGAITSTGAGTVTIAYNTGCGTQATKTHTVNAGPTPITGSRSICAGATSILDNITSDGTWSSANTAVATINTTTGSMTGIAMGTATISYRDGACSAIATVTINAIPTAITGSNNICTGTNTLLGNSALYGTWTSSNSTTGTINASGRFYGLNSGTTTISYNTGCGSAVAKIITVNTQPAAISGAASICEGSSSVFTNATTGGIWSSSNNAISSVNAATGAVNGIAEGIVNITYSIGICTSTAEVEIDPLPVSGIISGTTTLCEDDETNFATTGDEGTWTSSNNAVATIDADGVLSALAGGTANITYTATNTCGTAITTTNVTVTPTPNAGTITGASSMCTGVNSTLGNAQLTGIWSSSNTTVATVSATGVVTPLTTGNTSISYTVTNGCGTDIAETAITVNALPNAGAISGSSSICNTATTALTNTVNGGVWSSSNTFAASFMLLK